MSLKDLQKGNKKYFVCEKKRVGTSSIYETFQGLSTGVLLLKLKSMRGSGASKKIDHSKKVFAEDQYNANNTISR